MQKIKIGIVGLHQSGKSLLINCLLKRAISKVGTGSATTHTPVYYSYSDDEYAEYFDSIGCHEIIPENVANYDDKESIDRIHVYLRNSLLRDFTLVDLPGTGFNVTDNKTMAQTLGELDYAILLATDVKEYTSSSSFYTNTLKLLQEYNIPYYFIFNCTNITKWSPQSKKNIDIAQSDLDLLQIYEPLSLGLDHEKPLVNLMWYWCSNVDHTDKLFIEYYESIQNYFEKKGKSLSKQSLEEASKFYLVESIFDKRNRSFLELRCDFRKEICRMKDELCPIGTIQAFAFERIPHGWLLCNGQSLKIQDYPKLYNAIGISFGSNRKGEFSVPDLRSNFVRGWDERVRKFGSFEDDALQGHVHIPSCSKSGEHYHNVGYHHYKTCEANTFYSTYQHKHVWDYDDRINKKGDYKTSRNGGHKHDIAIGIPSSADDYGEIRMDIETRPKNVALLYCIKAKSL